MLGLAKKCLFIGCDKELVGRQTKFCSKQHRRLYYRMVNRPEYLKYNREYYESHKKENYCIVCGAILPKYKRKYCSQACYMKKYNKNPDYDVNRYAELPRPKTDYCEECGGKVIQDGFDYVCVVCGLVVE